MNGSHVKASVFLEHCPNDKVKTNFYKQFSRLNEFRDSGYLTDVNLVVGGTTYRAHKLVLACHSQVYEAMFNNDMLESQRGEVIISDVKPKTFSSFLNYVYTGVLPEDMTVQEATELLVCADKYQTTSLMCALDKALARKLNPDNAVELLQLADSFNRVTLKKHSRNLIWSNLAKTMTSESWKTIIPNNRQLMNELLVDFHKKSRKKLEELQGSQRCSRNEIRNFQQTWRFDTGIKAFRPKGVKLSYKGKPLNFIVVFARTTPDSVVSLYPTSTLPKGILIYCKVFVSRDGDSDSNREAKEYLFSWTPDQAHPTLGHRRVEILRWNWWDPDRTCVELELQAYDGSEELPKEMTPTIVEGWLIDQEPLESTVIPAEPDEIAEPPEDSVVLYFGERRVVVERSALMKSCRPHINVFWRYQEEVKLPEASEITGQTVLRYLNSGLYPPRDKVDLQLLEAAWELQLWNLVMYTEQALIWDLDPSNVVAIAKHCHNRALGWLVWACAQYLKLHLDRVISWDEEWRNFHHDYFEILINEMRDELYPCLLPNFLTAQRGY